MDCIEPYISDIQQGIEYYCNSLGLKVLWKSDSAAGLGMSEGLTEIVIQNERKEQNIDIKVDSVIEAVKEIEKALILLPMREILLDRINLQIILFSNIISTKYSVCTN